MTIENMLRLLVGNQIIVIGILVFQQVTNMKFMNTMIRELIERRRD